MRSETIKLLEESIQKKFFYIDLGNGFLDNISTVPFTKSTINKCCYIKQKHLCTAKEMINIVKMQPTE
jgi:hypothetical protein